MPLRTVFRLVSLTAALLPAATPSLATQPAAPDAAASASALVFADASYVHRWSKAGQNEYTPPSQTDLDHWDDMVTVLVYDQVTTEDALALTASRILSNYKRDGKILRTKVTPGTGQHKAEYLIVGVLPGGGIYETVFTRVVMTGDVGQALIYAHRFYGDKRAAEATADWLVANGQRIEDALTAWQDAPSPAALRTLPQAP